METLSNEMLAIVKENFNWANEVKTFKELKTAINDAGTKKDVINRYKEVVDLIQKDFSKNILDEDIFKSQQNLFKRTK